MKNILGLAFRHFPKYIFPGAISKGCLPRWQFSMWQLSKGMVRPSVALQTAMGAYGYYQNAEARTDLESSRLGNYTSGKLPLLNIPLGKLLLSKKPLGKFLILKNIRYFPNKKRVKLKRWFLFKSFLLRFSVMQWFDWWMFELQRWIQSWWKEKNVCQ